MAKNQALVEAKGDYDSYMQITREMKLEMKWWIDNVKLQSRKIIRPPPEVEIHTDASLEGWGASMNNISTGGRWESSESVEHINALELLAIFYALKAFYKDGQGRHVKAFSDNTTAVSYMNNMGGIKSARCNEIAIFTWNWAIKHGIWITTAHIAGKANNDADKASRVFKDHLEWKLDEKIFENISIRWGKPDIDLFATRLNAQIQTFCSWKPDPESTYVDAFTLNWLTLGFIYLFPPFSLIGRCLQKIRQEQAKGIVVAPFWPTQPWFTRLMELLTDKPVIIRKKKNLLRIPGTDLEHPLRNKLRIIVCKVSGKISGNEEFQRNLDILMSSWKSETKKQYDIFINRWFLYCTKRKINPMSPSLAEVIEFLTEQFQKGLGYESVNTARSALSSLGIHCEGFRIGCHPLIIRYMKGVFQLRPSKPRYTSTWDVNSVLNYLRKLSPVKLLSLKDLTLKVTMLMALIQGARVQTLHLVGMDGYQKLRSEFVFPLLGSLKQSRPSTSCSVISFKAYPPDRRLCIYTVLKEYLLRTRPVRKDCMPENNRLLVSYVKPYKNVTRDTISRWIKSVMIRANIDIKKYSLHSVRATAVSKAKCSDVPITDILRKAGWSRETTFAKFYDKKIEVCSDTFQAGVLQ